jgi:hypothetical protein
MTRARGLREVATIQTLRAQGGTSPRAQMATELARLELERSRLERILAAWEENRRRTAERLEIVRARASALQYAMATQPPAHYTLSEDADAIAGWHAVRMEY